MRDKTWYGEVDFHPEFPDVLKVGDEGDAVLELQELLKGIGVSIDTDSVFGGGTKRKVIAFQKEHGLVADGIVGDKTLRLLKQHPVDPKVLSQADIEWAANELGAEVEAVMAVNYVESRGSGFFDDTHPAILYERHVMYRRLEAHDINPAPYVKSLPGIVNTETGGYHGGIDEHGRLQVASNIDWTCGHESASWGLFQIMGYHWEHLGYASAKAFIDAMYDNEKNHLDAFVRFVKADPVLLTAIREKDWTAFARRYNGPAYHRNQYDVKMADAYADFWEDRRQ